jgi:hypothetical protein
MISQIKLSSTPKFFILKSVSCCCEYTHTHTHTHTTHTHTHTHTQTEFLLWMLVQKKNPFRANVVEIKATVLPRVYALGY